VHSQKPDYELAERSLKNKERVSAWFSREYRRLPWRFYLTGCIDSFWCQRGYCDYKDECLRRCSEDYEVDFLDMDEVRDYRGQLIKKGSEKYR